MKRKILIGLGLALVMLLVAALQAAGATTTIWQIGVFDESRAELAGSGLTGIHTFDFHVGTTPDSQFPGTLYWTIPPSPLFDDRGVHLVNIHFDLTGPYMDVNFVYGRAGDEVDYITLDGGFLAQIAGTENSWAGSPYTIPIGPLASGSHVITIEVIDGGTGDDAHIIDALKLEGNPLDLYITEQCDPSKNWRNHGEYVKCAAHIVSPLVDAGIITEEEASALMNPIARSDVGKP